MSLFASKLWTGLGVGLCRRLGLVLGAGTIASPSTHYRGTSLIRYRRSPRTAEGTYAEGYCRVLRGKYLL